jgi:hypothetical protein
VNIYITDLAAPGCRQPGLSYYRHRGLWAGDIFRKKKKKLKKKIKNKTKKNFLGKKALEKGGKREC